MLPSYGTEEFAFADLKSEVLDSVAQISAVLARRSISSAHAKAWRKWYQFHYTFG